MSDTPESQDVAMGGIDVGITNGHPPEAIKEKLLSEHVINGRQESQDQTTSGSSDNGEQPLLKSRNGHTTSAKSTNSSDISDEVASRPTTRDGQVNYPVKEDQRKAPSASPKQARITAPINSSQNGSQPTNMNTPGKTSQTIPESIKISKEVARLKGVLSETSPLAAQKLLREEWRTFLFEGFSEDHISFILRAILKNSTRSPRIVNNVLNDPNILENLLEKPAVVSKVLGSCSHIQISKHVPNYVLDKALAERLKNVEAMSLVRWLAEANRLGYKADDILDEEDESVTPNISGRPDSEERPEIFHVEAPRAQLNLAPPQPHQQPQQRDPLLLEQEKNLAASRAQAYERRQIQPQGPIGGCPDCRAVFPTLSGYNYHIIKKLCHKEAPAGGWKWICDNCVQGFTGKQGRDYHKANEVCTDNEIAPATPPSTQSQPIRPPPAISMPARPQAPHTYHPAVRPPMHNQQPQSNISIPMSSQYSPAPLSRPPISTHAPPPSTPIPTPPYVPNNVRRHPSELSPKEREALDTQLKQAQDEYEKQVADLQAKHTGDELQKKLVSAKNGINTKLSNIRSKHGVTLRMRQADKDMRKLAGITPPSRNRAEQHKVAQTNTPAHISPPAPSFSPVNGGSGSRNGSVSAGYSARGSPPASQPFRPRPYMPTSNPSGERPSGFGVMKMVNAPNYVTPYTSNKRRHSDDEDSSPRPNAPGPGPSRPQPWVTFAANRTVSQPQPSSGPGLAMMEMRSEDAASKLANWYKPDRPSTGGGPVHPLTSTGARLGSSGAGTRESAIVLEDTESESGAETIPAADIPQLAGQPEVILAPSIEKDEEMESGANPTETESGKEDDSEKDEGSPNRPRGMKAKRGGRHS
ncbi:hypothetical protein EG329_012746 [Mollisiaceae sp. DMI_Dod_QoI]|nr:hypothetical protein EG329_012746 [Helotiales sp. DMI_Dod_QoI]